MANKNPLLEAPPYPVERALKRLGGNLRTARTRRKLTIEEAAEKIGAGRRAVMDAEKGKASTAAGIYAGLLWAYDLLGPFGDLADPAKDEHGLTLASANERRRVRKRKGLSGDF
jgi:transcriptional regulator with XRE-family HTH domain